MGSTSWGRQDHNRISYTCPRATHSPRRFGLAKINHLTGLLYTLYCLRWTLRSISKKRRHSISIPKCISLPSASLSEVTIGTGSRTDQAMFQMSSLGDRFTLVSDHNSRLTELESNVKFYRLKQICLKVQCAEDSFWDTFLLTMIVQSAYLS